MALTEVNSLGIKDGEVKTADIAADAVTGAKIADDAVGAEHIEQLDADVSFADNAKAKFGAGNDLEIYHSGSGSYIADTGTGALILKASEISFTNAGESEHLARFYEDGAAVLLHNGSNRVTTTASGATITGGVTTTTASTFVGDVTFDNGTNAGKDITWDESENHLVFQDSVACKFGGGGDFSIYHDGTNTTLTNNTGDIYLTDQNGNIYIQAKANEQSIVAFADGAVDLYHDNTKKFETTSSGAKVSGSIQIPCDGTLANRNIAFERSNGSGDFSTFFGVTNYPDNSDYDDADDGYWANISAKGGCVVVINSDGAHDSGRNNYDHFSVYQKAGSEVSSAGRRLFSVDNVGGVQFGQAGIRIDNSWAGQPSITVQRNNNANVDNTNDSAYMRIHGIGETHGSWTGAAAAGADFSANLLIDGSSYDTSDRRAKTDIVDCPYGLDVINKLQPRKYQLVNSRLEPQGDDNINLGFIAQEIKEHIPECVNYLGDEADKPNEKGYAKAYALDIGEVIPVLVKAVQELSAKVAALEAK